MAISGLVLQDAGLTAILNASLDLDTSAMYAILLSGSYTPAQAHAAYSDISASEINQAGYARQALASAAIGTSGKKRFFTSASINFGSAVTLSAKYLAFLKGTAASPQAADLFFGWIDLAEVAGNLTALTKANPGQATSAAHGLANSDTVLVMNADMDLAFRALYGTVTVVDTNNFTIGVDLSGADYAGTRGRWIKRNDTTVASSNNSSFSITPPATGWLVLS